MQARYTSYQIGRQWGWLSANDIRGLEDIDPIPGIAGEAYLVPLNYQIASDLDKPKEQAPPPPADLDAPDDGNDDDDEPKKIEKPDDGKPVNFAPIVADLIDRATNRIYNALADKYKNKTAYWPEESAAILAKFNAWLSGQIRVLADAGYNPAEMEVEADAVKLLENEPDRAAWKALITKYLQGAENV